MKSENFENVIIPQSSNILIELFQKYIAKALIRQWPKFNIFPGSTGHMTGVLKVAKFASDIASKLLKMIYDYYNIQQVE